MAHYDHFSHQANHPITAEMLHQVLITPSDRLYKKAKLLSPYLKWLQAEPWLETDGLHRSLASDKQSHSGFSLYCHIGLEALIINWSKSVFQTFIKKHFFFSTTSWSWIAHLFIGTVLFGREARIHIQQTTNSWSAQLVYISCFTSKCPWNYDRCLVFKFLQSS